jgi:hypothetical protein
MYRGKRIWKIYTQRLINRGKVITLLIEPTILEPKLPKEVNKNKVGRKFQFSSALISAAFAVKCTLRLGYRQLQGLMEDLYGKRIKKIPNFRTIWWRIDRMKRYSVEFDLNSSEPVIGAIDATGLRPINDGEYRATRYGKMREWIKLHALIDTKTKQILNIKVTKGDVHDSVKFKAVIRPLASKISEIFADKGYDSVKIFDYCEKNRIFPGIPVKLNATNTIRSDTRKTMIEDQLGWSCRRGSTRLNRFLTDAKKEENQKKWKRKVGYGKRSTIEAIFSQYKLVLGENLFSRKMANIEKEITTKINVLNKFAVM